jgi:hypothetical protein
MIGKQKKGELLMLFRDKKGITMCSLENLPSKKVNFYLNAYS